LAEAAGVAEVAKQEHFDLEALKTWCTERMVREKLSGACQS